MTTTAIKTDGDGFLLDRGDWTEEVMYELAQKDGFELTDEHVKYILSARETYEEQGTVPQVAPVIQAVLLCGG